MIRNRRRGIASQSFSSPLDLNLEKVGLINLVAEHFPYPAVVIKKNTPGAGNLDTENSNRKIHIRYDETH